MVFTPNLVVLGMGTPLHPYYRDIIKWYNVVPIQLSPNNFILVATLFILYHDLGFGDPTMLEFSYFFSICKSDKDYFFFMVNKKHNKKGLSKGKTSQIQRWKEPFFYIWNVERTKVIFNLEPSKDAFYTVNFSLLAYSLLFFYSNLLYLYINSRVQYELQGASFIRAQAILDLPPGSFDLKKLIIKDNLKRVGLLSKKSWDHLSFPQI